MSDIKIENFVKKKQFIRDFFRPRNRNGLECGGLNIDGEHVKVVRADYEETQYIAPIHHVAEADDENLWLSLKNGEVGKMTKDGYHMYQQFPEPVEIEVLPLPSKHELRITNNLNKTLGYIHGERGD